jgi:hypothetical protein
VTASSVLWRTLANPELQWHVLVQGNISSSDVDAVYEFERWHLVVFNTITRDGERIWKDDYNGTEWKLWIHFWNLNEASGNDLHTSQI